MITYKKLKTSRAMAKHLKNCHLISMSISQAKDVGQRGFTYLVAQPRFSKDLELLQFSTFSSQEMLEWNLKNDPSGLFEESEPHEWTFLNKVPRYYEYREFKVDNHNYTIVKLYYDQYVFNLLMGEREYLITPLIKPKWNENDISFYNLFELINLGLLGRVTKLMFSSASIFFNEIKDLDSNVIRTTHFNAYYAGVRNDYHMYLDTKPLTLVKCRSEAWESLDGFNSEESLNAFIKGDNALETKITLRGKYSSLTMVVSMLTTTNELD